ncbi:MAG TPA: ATP-binding protein [Thermoanaerobaculia bacterium]|nr:ATP-binding protein [Thermoanaerobaculia bacterium]
MNDLAAQLKTLGLYATAASLDDLLGKAIEHRLAPRVLLEQIAQTETTDRARRSLERRTIRSRLGSFKPVADFDWNWPTEIDRPLLERALSLDFVRDGRNLILLGPNGIGKTMLVKNIAYQAVLAGYSVLFRTAAELLDDVNCDSPELRRRRIAAYSQPALLCIDEIGYLSYDDHAADLLYKVINPRYEKRRSLIVSTNLAFKEWNTVFPNATCIVTLIDRLTHHADVTNLKGKSYRIRESELEAAARRDAAACRKRKA